MTRPQFFAALAAFFGVKAAACTEQRKPDGKTVTVCAPTEPSPSVSLGDKFERAYDERERYAWPAVAPYAGMVGGEASLKSLRLHNARKNSAYWIDLKHVVSVRVSRTQDSGKFVIHLQDVDGFRTSLWCEPGDEGDIIPVNAITSY